MKNTLGASFVSDFTGSKIPIVPTPTPGEDVPIPSDGEVVIFDPTEPKEGDTPSEADIKEKIIERPVYIIIPKTSALLQLPERTYGVIKRVGILNNQPILYGDVNLLKQGQLYYISSAKQIYRFVKADTEYVYFTTIKPIKKNSGLLIPEEERGTIRNAGYLFNEIIYSGDPNLVSNGSLFYHDTLPYISIISNVNNVINLSTKEINDQGEIITVTTEYNVGPVEPDYSKQYLTTLMLNTNNDDQVEISITTNGKYSLDNGKTWLDAEADETITVSKNTAILWKNFKATDDSDFGQFVSDYEFDVYGNIMSLVDGDNFTELDRLSDIFTFNSLFASTGVRSAKNLILPTVLTDQCFLAMFSGSNLNVAPELPATILADGCYANMFSYTHLIESPVLPAVNITVDGCYDGMFYECDDLKKITAYFITDPSSRMFTKNWVYGVPEWYIPDDHLQDGLFIKNSAASWSKVGADGVPDHWRIETVDVPSDEIVI